MKILFRSVVILISLYSGLSVANGDKLVVVVNSENPTVELNKRQLIDLYMGKYVAFPNGQRAQPIDGPNSARKIFYDELVSMSLPQINSYWSRVRFTGRATPPMGYNSVEFIQDYLINNLDAIAYIPENFVTNDMKVVYRFE